MTSWVSALVRQATARLQAAGVPSAEHDSWALLEHHDSTSSRVISMWHWKPT